ncbi:hypothetical protein GC175_09365 [bacterium]|nr:hypothetical protein [bacterium]
MTPFSGPLPAVWEHTGVVAGFVLSLMIFSFILRDNWLVRLAQYLLVGLSLGYAAVIAWHGVLWPRLFQPLLAGSQLQVPSLSLPESTALWLYWLPLVLGLILWAAGVDSLCNAAGRFGRLRGIIRLLAILPLGLIVGVGVGVTVAGAIQGTLWPQFLRAAALGLPLEESLGGLLLGMLTILITTGALVHLHWGTDDAVGGVESAAPPTGPHRTIIAAWSWIGQRSLWLAAGFLFAQLFTSRVTLLIARLNYFVFDLRSTDVWIWLRALLGGS